MALTGPGKKHYKRGALNLEKPVRPGAKKARPPRRPGRMGRRRLVLACTTAVAALLVVVLAAVALAPPPASAAPAQSGRDDPEGPAAPLANIDLDAASLPAPETYLGTILAETGDAGMEYVQETLFLGDSNTQRMLYYSDITGASLDNCIGVVGMGITTFTTHKCVEFTGKKGSYTMPEAAALLQPRRIVVTFGSNNLGMAPARFIEAYKEALAALREACPNADIIIGAVFPVDRYCENGLITVDMVDRFNAALAALAESEGHKFLNWHEALRDETTGHCAFEYTILDGIHLSREGMRAIIDYFRTHSYITEDTRPAQAGKAPSVAGVMPGVVKADPYKPQGPYIKTAPSSSPSSVESQASSTPAPVQVTYLAWNQTTGAAGGGTVTVGGNTAQSATLLVAPGGACPRVAATPADGYRFAGWYCDVYSGAVADGFTLPASLAGGSSVTVTAVFEQIPVSGGSSLPETGEDAGSQGEASSAASPQGDTAAQSDNGA